MNHLTLRAAAPKRPVHALFGALVLLLFAGLTHAAPIAGVELVGIDIQNSSGANTPAATAFQVRAVDTTGATANVGSIVTWSITAGNATISTVDILSNASGISSFTPTPTNVGGLTLTACGPPLRAVASCASFRLVGYCPATLALVNTLPTSVAVGTRLDISIIQKDSLNWPRRFQTSWDSTPARAFTFTPAASLPPGVTNANVGFDTPGAHNITADSLPVSGPCPGLPTLSFNFNVTNNTAPSVEILPLSNSSPQTGESIALTANVSDAENNVVRLDYFQRDSTGATSLIASSRAIPWSASAQFNAPGEYAVFAVATDAGGLNTTSAAINVLVQNPRSPPRVRLTSPVTGANFGSMEAIMIEADVQDVDDDIASVEFIRVDSAGMGTRIELLRAPPWRVQTAGLTAGDYDFYAIAIDATALQDISATVRVTVRDALVTLEAGQITAPVIAAGTPFNYAVRAMVGGQPRAGLGLRWSVRSLDPNAAASAACGTGAVTLDTPNSGTIQTDVGGIANISFAPGCASGTRELRVEAMPGASAQPLIVPVAGPDQAAAGLSSMSLSVGTVYLRPNQAQNISATAANAQGAPISGVSLTWRLEPASVGQVSAASSTNSAGVASASLVLNAGIGQANLIVCILNRNDTCQSIALRGEDVEIAASTAQVATPIVQAAIEAPRVQISQLRARMQRTRNDGGHGFSNDVSFSVAGNTLPTGGGNSEGGDATGEGGAQDDSSAASKAEESRVGVFAMGSLDIGERGGGNSSGGYDVRTNGLTLGADYRLSDALTIGAALGGVRASSDSTIATQSTRGYSVSLFGQWLPTHQLYFAGVLNRGSNDYDVSRTGRRTGSGTGSGSNFGGNSLTSRLSATGESTQTAMQLETGYSFATGTTKFTPYLRYEFIRADIGSVIESGGPDAIAIDGYRSSLTTLSGGLQADFVINSDSGVWIPGMHAEFVREDDNTESLNARLVSNVSGFLPVSDVAIDQSYGQAGVSLQWLTAIKAQPLSIFFAFDTLFGRDNFSGNTISLGVKVPL